MKLALLLVVIAFAMSPMSRSEIKAFNRTYEMLQTGFNTKQYRETVFFGKKAIEDYKIIPLDNRTKIQPLQLRYVEIFRMVALSELHLSVSSVLDSMNIVMKQKDYHSLLRIIEKGRSEIIGSGILEKADSISNYFSTKKTKLDLLRDSIPIFIENDYRNASDFNSKKGIAERYAQLLPKLQASLDSLEYDSLEERYYQLMNQDNVLPIEEFISKHPRFDRIENLRNKRKEIINAKYNWARGQKTADAYKTFLEEYPNNEYTREIEVYLEWQVMREALTGESIYNCQKYMDAYPNGRYLKEVLQVFERLTRGGKGGVVNLPEVRD